MIKTGARLAYDLWKDGLYGLKKQILHIIVCMLSRIRSGHGFLRLIAGRSGIVSISSR